MESLFGLDRQDGRLWTRAEGDQEQAPDLIVTSGDDRDVLTRLRARYPGALLMLVGQPAGLGETDLPVLQRPLRFDAALRVLDGLHPPGPGRLAPAPSPAPEAPRAPAAQAPWPQAPRPAGAATGLGSDSRQPFQTRLNISPSLSPPPTPFGSSGMVSAGGGITVDLVLSASAPLASEAPAATPVRPALPEADVLVVGGKPRSRKSKSAATGDYVLTLGLRKLGLRVRQVADAADGLANYARAPVPFVFLDQDSLGDAFMPTARQLVALRPMPGMAPHVALVARHNRWLERLNARLYGCDWMHLPLDRNRLREYFAHRGQAL